MGGKSSGNQTTKTEPWKGQQPYLTYGFEQAQNLYGSGGPEYYPNATYVPFSPQSQMAMQLGQNRALMGSEFDQPAGNLALNSMQNISPFTLAATKNLWDGYRGMDQLNATTQGQYLNSNPYLDSMFNAATRSVNTQYNNQVMPGINATFGSGGRTGSNAHQTALDMANENYGNTIGDMAANIYGGNYANERTNQLNSAMNMGNLGIGMSGAMAGLGAQDYAQKMGGAQLGMQLGDNQYRDIGYLGTIGNMVEGKGQQALQDSMDRFNFYQNRPEQNLNNYVSWINGIPVNGGQTSTQGGGNALTSALGGALTGGALGGMLPASMLAAIPGGGWALAGLGGLLGLMG